MFNPKNSTEKGQRCTYKKKERKKKKELASSRHSRDEGREVI